MMLKAYREVLRKPQSFCVKGLLHQRSLWTLLSRSRERKLMRYALKSKVFAALGPATVQRSGPERLGGE